MKRFVSIDHRFAISVAAVTAYLTHPQVAECQIVFNWIKYKFSFISDDISKKHIHWKKWQTFMVHGRVFVKSVSS